MFALLLPSYSPRDAQSDASLRALTAMLRHERIEYREIEVRQCPDIAEAHNGLLERARQMGAKRSLIIDTDMAYEPGAALQLLHATEDYVGANYARKVMNAGATATLLPNGETRGALVEAAFVATGFLSLSKRALDKMAEAVPSYNQIGAPFPVPEYCNTGVKDGTWRSSDQALCQLWQSLGEKAWVDTSVRVVHMGLIGFSLQSAC